MKPANWIILSEYAKHVGTSAQVVTRSIDSGRIPASAVSRVPMPGVGGTSYRVLINQTEADPAWVAGFNEASGNPTDAARFAVERIQKALEAENERVLAGEPVSDAPSPTLPSQNDDPEDVTKISLAEAKRRETIAKAAKAQIELLQLKGSLVPKDEVYRQLFNVAQQLRASIMAIPARVTASIVATGGNQTEIQNILIEAHAAVMENLDDLNNVKIG